MFYSTPAHLARLIKALRQPCGLDGCGEKRASPESGTRICARCRTARKASAWISTLSNWEATSRRKLADAEHALAVLQAWKQGYEAREKQP